MPLLIKINIPIKQHFGDKLYSWSMKKRVKTRYFKPIYLPPSFIFKVLNNVIQMCSNFIYSCIPIYREYNVLMVLKDESEIYITLYMYMYRSCDPCIFSALTETRLLSYLLFTIIEKHLILWILNKTWMSLFQNLDEYYGNPV